MAQTLGSALAGRGNALNLVRLVLAAAVVLGHTTPLGGFAPTGLSHVGSTAVDGFFVLSGYLVAGSRMRLPLGRYLWHRALRILPAFWVSLIVVAAVLAPLAAAVSGEAWRPASSVSFLQHDVLVHIGQWGIDDTLQQVPFPRAWNGSLWTLEFELLAYLLVGVLLAGRLRCPHLRAAPHRRAALCLLTVLSAVLTALSAGPLGVGSYYGVNSLRLGAFFTAGMTLWALRDSLPRTRTLTVLAGVVCCALSLTPPSLADALTPLPLGYLLLSLGASRRVRLGSTTDLSYGVYIYAFPVQQLLATLGGHRLGYVGFFATSLALTAPLAWMSWTFVERPALRFKDCGRRLRGARAAPGPDRVLHPEAAG